MKKNQYLITAVILAVLGILAYLQFRTWRNFDWTIFFARTAEANKLYLAGGAGCIYLGYLIRAWRWQVFLRPVKAVPVSRLLGPMVIGFTGLAVLGRPGDLIRPYLIARKENLQFTSQFAVLAVERIFDMGCVALLLAADLLFAPSLRKLKGFHEFEIAGTALFLLVIAMSVMLVLIWKNGPGSAKFIEQFVGRFSPKTGHSLGHKILIFSDGLHTIHDVSSFILLFIQSMVLWLCIAFAYLLVTHAYPGETLQAMTIPQVLLLMSASIAGSLLQLPMVGGGSQLGTIGVLRYVFQVDENLAASAGIMLWVITFVAVVPLGLLLAHREHVSLRKLSEESQRVEEAETS